MLKTPIGRLRLIGMIEGLSFLVLLFFLLLLLPLRSSLWSTGSAQD